MTIPIEHGAHSTMHWKFKEGTEYDFFGDKSPMYGRTGEKHPMYGRTGDKNPSWKGDNVTPRGAYDRAKKLYKAGKLTEEEFKSYRDADREYRRDRRATRSRT